MKETKLQQNELDIIQANNGLKLYLRGLETGHEATPRSALYNIPGNSQVEQLEPDEILSRWMTQLTALEKGTNFEQNVFQFDSAQLQKWGPQGEVAPIAELLEEVVYPTFRKGLDTPAFSTARWRQAKEDVTRMLMHAGCRSLRPVSYKRVVDDMRARDTLESNSGWPLFTRRNKPEVVEASIEEAQNGLWKTYPAIALFRNYNRKTRLVWMFPMSANLVEGSFFQPLQSILMRSRFADEFLAPWMGFSQVRDLVTECYNGGAVIAASDFSSTDAHFKLGTSLEVYDVLAPCFQPQYREALKESISYMHSIPLVVSATTKLEGLHGVSSGSNWTNFIETIFDWVLSRYVELIEGDYSYGGLYAIGDDMSWVAPRRAFDADFSARLEEYGKSVGQEIRADKTTNYPDKVKSLQRLFQRGYFQPESRQVRAVYSTVRALKSIVYPERMHKKKLWSKDMNAIRCIMILENCVDHPLFSEFVRFVAEGDPYLRVFAQKPASEQLRLYRKSQLIPGLNSTYNQEKRDSSITHFAAVAELLK
jgi:hypothetical protein